MRAARDRGRRGLGFTRALISLVLGLLCLAPGLVDAHAIHASYVQLTLDRAASRATVDVSLVALDEELRLDSDGDGRLTWREVSLQMPRIAQDIGNRFADGRGVGPICAFERGRQPTLVEREQGRYLRLNFDLVCAGNVRAIDAQAWYRIDPQQRVYVQVDGKEAVVLTRDAARYELPAANAGAGRWVQFRTFFADGVVHLLTGYDHVAFLFVLLLGVTLARPRLPSLRESALAAVGVVSAFTIAHSFTLALAAFGALRLPSAPVEVAIAASVLVAALGTALRWPALHSWPIAFAFGLVHGLGFASVLGDLLTGTSLAGPLLAFNLGIEAGQLAIAVLVVPLLLLLGRRRRVQSWFASGASLGVCVLASAWLWQRLP